MVSKVNFFSGSTVVLLAFVRSGYVNLNNAYANNVGSNGRAWSRTANSSTNARNSNFDITSVNPSNNANRYNGYPLR